jgi:hypothetical protein
VLTLYLLAVHYYFADTIREIVALLLNNLKETKLKIYKSVFVAAVVSSQLFKHRGELYKLGEGLDFLIDLCTL